MAPRSGIAVPSPAVVRRFHVTIPTRPSGIGVLAGRMYVCTVVDVWKEEGPEPFRISAPSPGQGREGLATAERRTSTHVPYRVRTPVHGTSYGTSYGAAGTQWLASSRRGRNGKASGTNGIRNALSGSWNDEAFDPDAGEGRGGGGEDGDGGGRRGVVVI